MDKVHTQEKGIVLNTGRALLGALFVGIVCPFVCGVLVGRLMSGVDERLVVVGLALTLAVGAYAMRQLLRQLPRKQACNHGVYRAAKRLAHSDHCPLLMIEGKQIVEMTIDHQNDVANIICQNWRMQGTRNTDTMLVRYIIGSDGTVKKFQAALGMENPYKHGAVTLTERELDQLLETLETYPLQTANT